MPSPPALESPSHHILCPLDNRRTSKEMYIKLVAVTAPTFAAYCHFLVKRKEEFLIPRAVVFLLSPLSPVVRFVVPALLAIPASAVIGEFKWDTIGSWLSWIWGFKTPEHAPPQRPTKTRANAFETRNARLISGGRVLLLVLFIAQCIMSITLFVRRAERGAAGLVDLRVFYLAVGGLSFTIIAIGERVFKEHLYQDDGDYLEIRSLRRFRLYASELMLWLFVVLFVLMCETPEAKALSWVYSQRMWVMTVPLIPVFEAARAIWMILDDSRNEWHLPTKAADVFFLLVAVFGVLLIISAAVAMLYVVSLIAFANVVTMFKEISMADSWPMDELCPFLWKDPINDWLWPIA